MRHILLLLCSLALAGCSYIHPYRPNIQQGNIINTKKVNQLHHGMTGSQVIRLMGTPVMTNSFDDTRVTYIYTDRPNNGPEKYKRISLTFKNDRLASIVKAGFNDSKH